MFRSLAALVFCTGGAILIAALSLLGDAPGVPESSRHLRAMKRRMEVPGRVQPTSFAGFAALPTNLPEAQYAPLEARGVSLEGWVQRVLVAGDGDLHLELVSTPRPNGIDDTLYVTAEITPGFRRSAAWHVEPLLAVLRPNGGGPTPWNAGPQKVRVSGWLLFDFQYDRPPTPWSQRPGGRRLTGWEIHPVTRLERWSDRARTWVEVPR